MKNLRKNLMIYGLALLLSIADCAFATNPIIAVIYKDFEKDAGLELYSDESFNNDKIIGMYYNGVEVTLLSDPAFQLAKVRIGEVEGYIQTAYLVYDKAKIDALPVQHLSVKTISLKKKTSKLNLRQKPSQDSRSEGQFAHGQEVYLLGVSGEWSHVMIGDKTGFMKTSFLQDTGRSAAISLPNQSSEESKPLQGSARTYSVEKRNDYRGYSVMASLVETAENTFAVDIHVQYPDQWTMNDDIISFGVYVNGEKVANAPASGREGYLPSRFQTSVDIDATIQSIRVVPNWGKMPDSQEEAVDIPVI